MCSSVLKKVLRSGRRWGGEGLGAEGMLCSTG